MDKTKATTGNEENNYEKDYMKIKFNLTMTCH